MRRYLIDILLVGVTAFAIYLYPPGPSAPVAPRPAIDQFSDEQLKHAWTCGYSTGAERLAQALAIETLTRPEPSACLEDNRKYGW